MTTHESTFDDAITPLQAVAIGLLTMVVAGGCLLLSVPESVGLIDGALEWDVESPLRAVVQLLCLNYQFPTMNAGQVKVYLLGIGAGLLVLALTIAVGWRSPTAVANSVGVGFGGTQPGLASGDRAMLHRWFRPSPLTAAQLLVGLYLLWALASSRWSAAPGLALGNTLLVGIFFGWSFGLAHVLGRRAVRIAMGIIVATTGVTAATAVWYFLGRNPTIRAKFPFGNPTFLATCLIPGILLAVTSFVSVVHRGHVGRATLRIAYLLGCVITVSVAIGALVLTGSRGALVGLVVGFFALLFFSLRGWAKMLPMVLTLALVVAGALYFHKAANSTSPTGRAATLRFRAYAWSYAARMFLDRPVTGHGMGAFVLEGDSYAAGDVLSDPSVFTARIAHAHNEWLEELADLGAVGFLLMAGALFMTLRAGAVASRSSDWADRWAQIGLLSGFTAICVSETFGVGLRVSGVPTLFYTLLGLLWAGSRQANPSFVWQLSTKTQGRLLFGIVGGTAGLLTLILMQQDFQAARRAYEVERKLEAGEYEDAADLVESASSRLNPQRALVDLLREGRVHMLVADKYQRRAAQRQARARESDVTNRKLLALAEADRATSEAHCVAADTYLKELVLRSPGFFNLGWIEYRVNMIRAQDARAHGNENELKLAIRSAIASLDRELRRQPFNPVVALAYADLAPAPIKLDQVLVRLARPLRFHRITPDYLEVLARIYRELHQTEESTDPLDELAELASRCERLVATALPHDPTSPDAWAPEMLRLLAAWRFMSGDYKQAREYLLSASKAYERIVTRAPLGAASCFDELAECSFLSDVENVESAITYANKALAAVPVSRLGRELSQSINQRLVSYYLAAGNESQARGLLLQLAPGEMDEQSVRVELGERYRRLCELVLTRRDASQLRKSATSLAPKLDHWLTRAMMLNPADANAHYLACDLAFHDGDCKAAANHLRVALNKGLAPATAAAFVRVAIGQPNVCQSLKELADELGVPQATPGGAGADNPRRVLPGQGDPVYQPTSQDDEKNRRW